MSTVHSSNISPRQNRVTRHGKAQSLAQKSGRFQSQGKSEKVRRGHEKEDSRPSAGVLQYSYRGNGKTYNGNGKLLRLESNSPRFQMRSFVSGRDGVSTTVGKVYRPKPMESFKPMKWPIKPMRSIESLCTDMYGSKSRNASREMRLANTVVFSDHRRYSQR